jgi:hypothetical protein
VYNPAWQATADTNRLLVVSEDIPNEKVTSIKDSLKLNEVLAVQEFTRKVIENVDFSHKISTIYLLGQSIKPEILSKLTQNNIVWLPYIEKNQLQDIHWNGVIHKGEMQEIRGKITLSEPKTIIVKWANQGLDSLKLPKGFSSFNLHFPAFAIGQTTVEVLLDKKPLQKVSFYTQKNLPQHFLLLLSNPDFESKILADWLGKNGNSVEVITTIAKNTQNNISINQSSATPKKSAAVVITDPSNAGNTLVKKAYADGKSVLFINLENAESAIKNINQWLGTHWKLQRISTQENRIISSLLTAQPFDFAPNIFQKKVAEYPVAIQQKIGKVGVSLLNETFPMMLSGDSLTYSRVWQSIFQPIKPDSDHNIIIDAPIFEGIPVDILLNNREASKRGLSVSKDTISMTQSAINPLTTQARYTFNQSGWHQLQDSLSVYVEEKSNAIAKTRFLAHYVKNRTVNRFSSPTKTNTSSNTTLPEWIWFASIVLLMSALWLEPKLKH